MKQKQAGNHETITFQEPVSSVEGELDFLAFSYS